MPRSTDLPALPAPLTRFFGRTHDIAEVGAKLCSGQTRLLTLAGPGGVGKTRLGLEVATTVQEHFADGVSFIPLSTLAAPDLLLSTLVLNLGIEGDISADPGAQLRAFLHTREVLLVLDNLEQIVAAAPVLGELLAACPGLHVLATSRMPLRIAGEHVYPVTPLPVPDACSAAGMDYATLTSLAAVALFADRASAVDPTFALSRSTILDITDVCRRSDGLPLAIELAAARLRVLSPGELAMRLEPRLPLLSGGPQNHPDRLRTMRAAIAWSYDLLPPAHQTLFRRLALFVGGFGITAVEQMASDLADALAVDLLGELIDATLVQRTAGPANTARFTMLETIREFGLEQLCATGEESTARDAHAAWCMRFAEDAGPHLSGPDHVTWWRRIEAEVANIRLAFAWLARKQDAGGALRLGVALDWFWAAAGYFGEGRTIYRHLATMPHAEHYPALLARVLSAAGNFEHWLDNLEEAEALNRRALGLYRDLPDPAGVVSTLRALGSIAVDRDDLPMASRYLAEAQALAPAAGAAWDAAAVANLQAIVALGQGKYTLAATRSEEAIRAWHALGDTGHVGTAQVNLARATLAVGDHRLAAEILSAVLQAIQADVGDDVITGACFEVAAGIALADGHARRCLQLQAAAHAMAGRMGIRPRPAFATDNERQTTAAQARVRRLEAERAWDQGAALSLEAAIDLARTVVAAATGASDVTGSDALTQREQEVLRLVAGGHSDKEIAQELGITRHTASNHVANIRAKLGVPSRAAIAAVAVRDGLA